ncbi:MAG: hypothetical protein ABI845_01120 [Polaromonas sp.]
MSTYFLRGHDLSLQPASNQYVSPKRIPINATRIISYLPQIIAVWRCTDGALSVSLLTWGSWVLSHVAAMFYGVLVIPDLPFVLIPLINLLGCACVTAIAMQRRKQWRRERSLPRCVQGFRRKCARVRLPITRSIFPQAIDCLNRFNSPNLRVNSF